MAGNKESSVQDCEEYIEQHGIQRILQEAIVKICQDRPQNPMKYLRDHFDTLYKVGQAPVIQNAINTIRIDWYCIACFYIIFVGKPWF